MLILVTVLTLLLAAQTVYLLYYKRQITDIGHQLKFIVDHTSFKLIATQIKPKEIDNLVGSCNSLLTRQRIWEQQLSQKNEELNATIVSLSHDIRTPLTSLDGYLQLALRSEEPQAKEKYVTLAQTRIRQITKLVGELFLYTKLQNPEYVLEFHPIDIMLVLKQRLFAYIEEFDRGGYEPILDLPESPVHIVGNSDAVERIFENIIGNFFVHGAGSLSIRSENKPDTVVIHFTNRLKENTSVDMERIFIRFYKGDTSRTVNSSGLGLSIVKSLMEKLGGLTEAEYKDDSFRITIAFKKATKEISYG